MKGCVLPRYVQHSFWAEISLTLMIDANERVGYHHDEHCAIFPRATVLMPTSSWPIVAALVVTQVGRKVGGRAHFGSEREGGKGPTGCHSGAAAFQTHTPPQTVQARAEATQATESAF
jgi:hypothetical protein